MRIIIIVRKPFAFSIFRLPKQTDLTDSDLCEMPVDDVRPLSPATLVAIVNKEDTGEEEINSAALPGGSKECHKSPQTDAAAQEARDALLALASEPAAVKAHLIARGEWDAATEVMTVSGAKGRTWEGVGTRGLDSKGRHVIHLRWEEALFMLEAGQVMMSHGGLAPVSAQRARAVLMAKDGEEAKNGASKADVYAVYSYLVKLG